MFPSAFQLLRENILCNVDQELRRTETSCRLCPAFVAVSRQISFDWQQWNECHRFLSSARGNTVRRQRGCLELLQRVSLSQQFTVHYWSKALGVSYILRRRIRTNERRCFLIVDCPEKKKGFEKITKCIFSSRKIIPRLHYRLEVCRVSGLECTNWDEGTIFWKNLCGDIFNWQEIQQRVTYRHLCFHWFSLYIIFLILKNSTKREFSNISPPSHLYHEFWSTLYIYSINKYAIREIVYGN